MAGAAHRLHQGSSSAPRRRENQIPGSTIALGWDDYSAAEKHLRTIGSDSSLTVLGLNERAEILRLFAFRKLSVDSMLFGLRAVDALTSITRLDHSVIASFVVDTYKIFGPIQPKPFEDLLDYVYRTMRDSAASPDEFIAAFNSSRHLALSRRIDADIYFMRLREGLENGVMPENMSEYLLEDIEGSG